MDDRIAERLATLRAAESRIAEDLLELDENPTYTLLAAGDMAGATGRRVNPLVAEAPLLWTWLGTLRSHLDRAEALLAESGGWFGGRSTGDAETLLDGRTVAIHRASVPSRLTPPTVVVDDDGAYSITPNELLGLIRSVYEPIREAVADVDAVWQDLIPRLEASEKALVHAEAVATRLEAEVPELVPARQRLDAVRASVVEDPLGLATSVGPDLDALIARAAGKAGALERSHGSLSADTSRAEALVAELRALRARAAASWSEAHAKITPANQLVRTPSAAVIDGPQGLAHRLTEIVEGDHDDWHEARRQLDRWLTSAGRLRVQLSRAVEVNRAPLDRRDELRGLWRAYATKLASIPEPRRSELQVLGDQIHRQLHRSPTDLPAVEGLLDEFVQRSR